MLKKESPNGLVGNMEFKWSICNLCGPCVICPKCGNNYCNGTFGGSPGNWCDICPKAYDFQDLGIPPEFIFTAEYQEWLKLNKDYVS